MKRSLLIIMLFSLLPVLVKAQLYGPQDPDKDHFNSIRQNGVSTIAAYGDTLWISPALNRNIANEAGWFTSPNADSVNNGTGRVFSLSLSQDTVVAGLGFSSISATGSVPSGYGFYISTNGGNNWLFEKFPTDPNPTSECETGSETYDPDCDIAFTYGGETYYRVRNTVREQSPPYSIDHKGDVILAASWASGLIRSRDFGETWERIILPPFNSSELSPDNSYTWRSTVNGQDINRYDPRFDNNLLGFGLLIDTTGRVWFGSAGGLNVSNNALSAPADSIGWRHIRFNNSADGLLGNWIIRIRENIETGRIWMTNWVADSQEKQGLVYTDDGGNTFIQTLIGERINDIGFKDNYVFATGDNGLFISNDGGNTWIRSPQIQSPNTFIKNNAQFYSVASTTNRVWIGTEDGLASTSDYGQTWEITRVDFPLKGGNVYQPNTRNVESYAYPNPFSPRIHDVVRIKFELNEGGNTQIRIFDTTMGLVKKIEGAQLNSGTYEAVWDGTDSYGRTVANGPYIYVIDASERQITGKILLAR
ncbi:MAG: FlgD immunoglobulin-like domain containing protein [Gracilimonas sp.]|nr:FlgD immunoglobulin-like domain containing protein [Gracilimonas sp.]